MNLAEIGEIFLKVRKIQSTFANHVQKRKTFLIETDLKMSFFFLEETFIEQLNQLLHDHCNTIIITM